MKKLLIPILILVVLVTGCAPGSSVEVETPKTSIELTTPGPNPLANEAAENGRVAGVVQGLWHGIISPVMAIGAFFNPDMQMYEVHNNGREYNLGFLFGVALVFLLLGVIGGRGGRRR
ncbi:MAG TPA: hypothetical protein VFQ13_07995 [Anaerolineales bacterium]|nr:hypothetical protein [Anaerolineales bacterium]